MFMETLTDEQLAGQRLMVGFKGITLNSALKYLIDKLCVGGLILFSRNIESPGQLADLCASVQNYTHTTGHPPLLIAIDQEGGVVARLKPPFSIFPGNPAIGNEDSDRGAIEFAETTARELKEVGIHMNFAPVLDVAPAGFDSVMKERIFSNDPDRVAHLGGVVIQHLQQQKVAACAKHFPGIGHTTLDSHLDLPYLNKGREAIDTFDLVPFRAAIATGVYAVMLSHVVYTAIDPQWPASLSRKVASDLLRGELGFQGVVFTDDLDMGAIAKYYDMDTITKQVLEAEVDIILMCHTLSKMEAAYNQVLSNIKSASEARERSMRSVRRILRLKERCVV
jgi:beta-N-acetylhexosaminidase